MNHPNLLVVLFFSLLASVFQTPARSQEQPIVRLTESRARNRAGTWSPDGRRIAFVSNRSGTWQLWRMRVDGTDPHQLTYRSEPVGKPSWSPDGTVLWFESGFSLYRLALSSGEASRFDVGHQNAFRPVPSPDGRTLLFDVSKDGNHDVWVRQLTGTGFEMSQLTADPGYDSDARWSPDGSQIVFHSDRGAGRFETQVFVMFQDGSNIRPLTTGPSRNAYPAWSPNGRCIVYTSETEGNRDLWLMDSTGSNKRRLTTYKGFDGDPTWNPKGGSILFSTSRWGGEELALLKLAVIERQKCEA